MKSSGGRFKQEMDGSMPSARPELEVMRAWGLAEKGPKHPCRARPQSPRSFQERQRTSWSLEGGALSSLGASGTKGTQTQAP